MALTENFTRFCQFEISISLLNDIKITFECQSYMDLVNFNTDIMDQIIIPDY